MTRPTRPARRASAPAVTVPGTRAVRGTPLVPAVTLVLLVASAVWVWFRAATGIVLEDALITYRHAENLALGRGFGFNPGEPVLGTTSPLMTLALAAIAKVVGVAHIPVISNVLGIAASLGTGVLVARMLARTGHSTTFTCVVVLLVSLHQDIVWSTVGGLETPLVVFFMALGLEAMQVERWNRAAIATSLLLLTRVDGAVWALALLAIAALRLRFRVVKPLAIGLAVLVPWLVYAWITFGNPLPNSIFAKREIGLGAGSVKYLPWVMSSLGVTFIGDLTPFEFPIWLVFLAAGAARIVTSPRLRGLLPVVVFPPAFGLAMWLTRAPAFEWYMVPLTWCCLVVACQGSLEMRDMITAHADRRGWPTTISRTALACAWIVVAIGLATRWVDTFEYQRTNQQNETGTRRRLGEWLRDHSRSDAVVAMEAIGYQGTFSQRRVIDLAGIVSPAVVDLHRETGSNARTLERVLDTYQPDFLVLRSYEFEQNRHHHGGPLFETAAEREAFVERYREVWRVTAPHPETWGDNARLSVFARAGSPRVVLAGTASAPMPAGSAPH